jgi:hypothetical protein
MSAILNDWRETHDAALDALWAQQFPGVPAPRVFERNGFRALVGREPIGDVDVDPDPRWHISLSRADRTPTWDELVDAAHALRPGIVFCVPMPPRSWWVNVHEHTLHLWEIGDLNLVNQWRSERRGDEPT